MEGGLCSGCASARKWATTVDDLGVFTGCGREECARLLQCSRMLPPARFRPLLFLLAASRAAPLAREDRMIFRKWLDAARRLSLFVVMVACLAAYDSTLVASNAARDGDNGFSMFDLYKVYQGRCRCSPRRPVAAPRISEPALGRSAACDRRRVVGRSLTVGRASRRPCRYRLRGPSYARGVRHGRGRSRK